MTKTTWDRQKNNVKNIRWLLIIYDAVMYTLVSALMLFYNGREELTFTEALINWILIFILVTGVRIVMGVYRQIWRYGGIQSYMLLLASDGISLVIWYIIQSFIPVKAMMLARIFGLIGLNLLGCLAMRMVYRYIYKYYDMDTALGRTMYAILRSCGASEIRADKTSGYHRIKVAIIGAGRRGVGLAEEMSDAGKSPYSPVFFADINREKIGRTISHLPVFDELDIDRELLEEYGVQEVIIAIPAMDNESRKKLYAKYKQLGCNVKMYDAPSLDSVETSKIRDIAPEELLFRRNVIIPNQKTREYYKGKTILITGGGGSIGSELCRQLAGMEPEKIVILDIYENGAYDVQQELKMKYRGTPQICVEIASIRDKDALDRVFAEYKPQIVIMAAAHKHVPLMEKNCIEAVKNNVFGTLNTIEASEKYGVDRVIMVSTDKAVNPTNIMGATKRMCEMISLAYSARNSAEGRKTTYSMTRFGNVLGSAGSVIPLFKKQIANGGPVTVTDKRITRYFMTIPEASQLVLESGAMAVNGELFVLDMGQPVKIYELAQNLVQLSGAQGIDIIETGLRPGEKLYEELLVKTDEMDKTENSLIFIEKYQKFDMEDIEEKLSMLEKACVSGNDEEVKKVLKETVPTYLGSAIN